MTQQEAIYLLEQAKNYVDTRLASVMQTDNLQPRVFEEMYMRTNNGGLPLDQQTFRQFLRHTTLSQRGISSVTKSTSGHVDTYTIHYSDNTEYSFSVTNGDPANDSKVTLKINGTEVGSFTLDSSTDVDVPIKLKTINSQSIVGEGNITIQPAPSVVIDDSTTDTKKVWSSSKVSAMVSAKQDSLVSGSNIKTINGSSILGSGDVEIQGGGQQPVECTITYNITTSTWSTTGLDAVTEVGVYPLKATFDVQGQSVSYSCTMTTMSGGGGYVQQIYNLPYYYQLAELAMPTRDYLVRSGESSGDSVVWGGWQMSSHIHPMSEVDGLTSAISGKQSTLVSGTNIKTINNQSVLGSGNITISGGATINDDATENTSVWSSAKTYNEISSSVGGLADVAQSGSYNDLTDKPTIPSKVLLVGAYNLAINAEMYTSEHKLSLTSTHDDHSFSPEIYAELTSGHKYTVAVATDCATWGGSGDSVEWYLLFNNGYSTIVSGSSLTMNSLVDGSSSWTFTASASGWYKLRLDINQSGHTYNFWNIRINEGEVSSSVGAPNSGHRSIGYSVSSDTTHEVNFDYNRETIVYRQFTGSGNSGKLTISLPTTNFYQFGDYEVLVKNRCYANGVSTSLVVKLPTDIHQDWESSGLVNVIGSSTFTIPSNGSAIVKIHISQFKKNGVDEYYPEYLIEYNNGESSVLGDIDTALEVLVGGGAINELADNILNGD